MMQQCEHVIEWALHGLGVNDHRARYDAVERDLLKSKHIGDYYYDRCDYYLTVRDLPRE